MLREYKHALVVLGGLLQRTSAFVWGAWLESAKRTARLVSIITPDPIKVGRDAVVNYGRKHDVRQKLIRGGRESCNPTFTAFTQPAWCELQSADANWESRMLIQVAARKMLTTSWTHTRGSFLTHVGQPLSPVFEETGLR